MMDSRLAEEVVNESRVPFKDMSVQAQNILCLHWKNVETYHCDACSWVPNFVCPRQWNSEAYRVNPKVFENVVE